MTKETFGSVHGGAVMTSSPLDSAALRRAPPHRYQLGSIIQAALLLAALAILYHDTFAHIISVWQTPEGSHGPLIVAVSLYLIWIKRSFLIGLSPRPAYLPGTLLCGVGCFMLFAGKLSSTMLLQMVSLVPTILGAIWLLYGKEYLKVLFIPVAYIIFLTGLIERLLVSLAIYFQTVSAWIAAKLLDLIGIPVLLYGTIVEMPHIALEVVRSCSGINHIVSLMALSIPLAFICQLTPVRKCLLLLISFVIGVFANGVRIALIGVYALYNKGADLHGPSEILYVTFIFFFGMVLLVVISNLLKTKALPASADQTLGETLPQDNNLAGFGAGAGTEEGRKGRSIMAFAAAVAIFLTTLGLIHFYKPGPVPLASALAQLPDEINRFSGKNLAWMDERLRPFPADQELLRVYENGAGIRVELYIGYFSEQDRERKIIDYRRDWMHEEAQKTPVGSAADAPVINKTRLRDRRSPADVYFWYVMDDKIILNQYAGKFLTFWNALTKRKTNAAVVVIQTQNRQDDVMPLLIELVPQIQANLAPLAVDQANLDERRFLQPVAQASGPF